MQIRKPSRQSKAEDGAQTACSVRGSRAVKDSTSILKQCRKWIGSFSWRETVNGGECPCGTDAKDGSIAAADYKVGSTCSSCAVKIAIGSEDQPSLRPCAISAARKRGERRGHASNRSRVHRPIAQRAARRSSSIKCPIGTLCQRSARLCPIRSGKRKNGSDSCGRTKHKNGSLIEAPAQRGRSVEIAVNPQQQRGMRACAIGAVEGKQVHKQAIGCDREKCAATKISSGRGSAVEESIWSLR